MALEAGMPDSVIAYGSHDLQHGELWLPAGAPKALVLFVHGGCWLNTYGVDHSRPLCHGLRARGYAVWAIEYRRLGDAGGGWPGTFDDVAAAVAHLPRLGLNIGPAVIMGHSAGGHLALWATSGAPPAPNLCGVLALAPIVDLASFSQGAQGDSACQRAVLDLMGGSVDTHPERYRAATPAPGHLPTALLHGEQDEVVPLAQSVDHGFGDCTRRLAGAGHFDLIHPGSAAWPAVLETLESLLP